MANITDQSQNEIPSQNLSKHFEQSDFYQKFIMGHNILNDTEFSGVKDPNEYTNPAPYQNHSLEQNQQADISLIKNKVIDQNKKLNEQKFENLRLERIVQEFETRIQAFKQQNQNLIKEVERLQKRPDDNNIQQEKQLNSYREDMQGLRNRILQETNLKMRAIDQMEEYKEQIQQLQQIIDDLKVQQTGKTDELKQQDRVCELYKTELYQLKKKYVVQEENLAESKAQSQGLKDENQEIKLELIRQKDQAKHLQNDNMRLRKEIDIIKISLEKNESKLQEQKHTITQFQQQADSSGKQESYIKLKQQLESANQDINKYRALQAQGITNITNIQNTPPKIYPVYEIPRVIEKNIRIKSPIQYYEQNPPLAENQRFNHNKSVQEDFQTMQQRNQSPPSKQQNAYYGTLAVGDRHMQNYDQIQDLEQMLMNLSLKKNEIEGHLSRLETSKIKSQGQITRKKHLEQEFEMTNNQIQTIRKSLRNYNAIK